MRAIGNTHAEGAGYGILGLLRHGCSTAPNGRIKDPHTRRLIHEAGLGFLTVVHTALPNLGRETFFRRPPMLNEFEGAEELLMTAEAAGVPPTSIEAIRYQGMTADQVTQMTDAMHRGRIAVEKRLDAISPVSPIDRAPYSGALYIAAAGNVVLGQALASLWINKPPDAA